MEFDRIEKMHIGYVNLILDEGTSEKRLAQKVVLRLSMMAEWVKSFWTCHLKDRVWSFSNIFAGGGKIHMGNGQKHLLAVHDRTSWNPPKNRPFHS
jgi:hypothetical protein